ncbi:MAG: sugar ABC transporter substrate-binding protein [Prosthecobacter sp.]
MPRLSFLLPVALFLTACRPSEEQPQPGAPPVSESGIPLPPEIVEKTGLGVKDERAGIILLLQDTRVALQEFQRNGLVMLVGRQAGYKLTTQDAAASASRQQEQFRQAIAAKPAAIFVSPVDPASLAALIVEAQTAGIIVIGLDKRMLNEGCASIVFSDQHRVGLMAAQTVLDALKRKAAEENRAETTGRVVQIRGAEDSFSTNELAEGFVDGLRKEPGVIVVHDAPADWKAETATLRTAEAFRLQKQFDVIFAHNDTIALGAAKAATDAGQRESVFIIGTDGIAGQKRGMELVRQGELDATIVQPALVDLALQIVLRMRKDKHFKPQAAYEIEPVAVVPKNVEQSLRMGTYKLPKL